MYSKNPQGNATCYDSLSFATASVLNDIVVTYRVSYSNSNDWNEISWTWNALESVNKIFPLFRKKSFHLKNYRVSDAPCICVHHFHVALCLWVLMWLPKITFCHNYSILVCNEMKEKKMSLGWTSFQRCCILLEIGKELNKKLCLWRYVNLNYVLW